MSGDTDVFFDRAAELWRVTVAGDDGQQHPVQGSDGQPAGWLDYTDADQAARELSPPRSSPGTPR